ncbi:LLM class flavin-dependent oxidoreductase [Streptomyces sp. NPDC008125]|uniref:LLM class flavin-dependent oxidoreductase n=1 Tax=Streptomyces sp. NPDC008125 TaxID=3364811 RepID=UPI0036E252C6
MVPSLPPPSLHLALEADGDGAHPAAWRAAPGAPSAVLSPATLTGDVRLAESAGFALVTFDDGPLAPYPSPDAAGRIEAGVRAAFLSTRTGAVGLAPTLHVTTTEPFHLATQLAGLDHLSLGRGGWVVGATDHPRALATVGAPPRTAEETRRETAEVITAARLLWDSWEDDAVIADRDSARYLDADRVHRVGFRGEFFSVVGPLITPRPPQGQLVVAGADTLGVTGLLDIAFVAADGRAALEERAGRARREGAPLVFADVDVVLDTPERPADARLRELDAFTPWPGDGRLRHTGSAEGLRDLLEALAHTVDGVRLHPAVLAVDLPVLATGVLPALIARGAVRPPVPGARLRDTLGLPKPANRFAAGTTPTPSR